MNTFTFPTHVPWLTWNPLPTSLHCSHPCPLLLELSVIHQVPFIFSFSAPTPPPSMAFQSSLNFLSGSRPPSQQPAQCRTQSKVCVRDLVSKEHDSFYLSREDPCFGLNWISDLHLRDGYWCVPRFLLLFFSEQKRSTSTQIISSSCFTRINRERRKRGARVHIKSRERQSVGHHLLGTSEHSC